MTTICFNYIHVLHKKAAFIPDASIGVLSRNSITIAFLIKNHLFIQTTATKSATMATTIINAVILMAITIINAAIFMATAIINDAIFLKKFFIFSSPFFV